MNKYLLTFSRTHKIMYRAFVDADSAKDAVDLLKNSPFDHEWEMIGVGEDTELLRDIKAISIIDENGCIHDPPEEYKKLLDNQF